MRNGDVHAGTIKRTDNCEIYKISRNIFFRNLHKLKSFRLLCSLVRCVQDILML
jgi:hypothetical protein